MKIKNASDIATTRLRKDAISIAEAGLVAIDTRSIIRESVTLEDGRLCVHDVVCSLSGVNRIFVIGVGKCSISAAEELEVILGDSLVGGIVCDVRDSENVELSKIKSYRGSHPFPSDKNISITREIIKLLSNLREDDLVLVIVSGGGSTLLCNPEKNMTCVNERAILKKLVEAGASIREINTIRKHISLARGGFLAKEAYPAQVIGLIFSDVPGNQLDMIASGPTVKDTTSVKDADRVLEKYDVLRSCDMDHCGLIETPKDDKYFERVQNILLASNERALLAMKREAVDLGYGARIMKSDMEGEARDIGKKIAKEINKSASGTVLLYGGESTVTVVGDGKGGRNQELALSALTLLEQGRLIMAIASDGWDNSEHAGALVDCEVENKEAEEYLKNNNSFEFFKKSKTALLTGYTGSNVADLVMAISEK